MFSGIFYFIFARAGGDGYCTAVKDAYLGVLLSVSLSSFTAGAHKRRNLNLMQSDVQRRPIMGLLQSSHPADISPPLISAVVWRVTYMVQDVLSEIPPVNSGCLETWFKPEGMDHGLSLESSWHVTN
jgi:hypothetical protein